MELWEPFIVLGVSRRMRSNRVFYLAGGLLGILILAFVVARLFLLTKPSSRAPSVDQTMEDFFALYWQRPIALQGSPPRSFSEKEASLSPEACGSCHTQQYADWKESLHSKAMGPGPWGQIIDLTRNSPEEARSCQTCHAPLSEQFPFLSEGSTAGNDKNPHFDSRLQVRGITCAACHVRQHQRFGPPKAEGAASDKYPPGTPDHGGVQRTPYFERAEFCKECHQFDPENTMLVNGKPMMDTYREWKNSTWGQGGAACQDCHMPNRRHLWKGIHDPEMVKGALRVEARAEPGSLSRGKPLKLTMEVTNAAVGHKFPTYSTPKAFVRAVLLDESGKSVPGTQQEKIIGWDARFEGGEWKEYFDTRIPPGENFQAIFRWNGSSAAKKIRAWVEVHPDHFYNVHFYPAYLKGEDLSPEGRRLIEKALQESGRSSYIVFERTFSID